MHLPWNPYSLVTTFLRTNSVYFIQTNSRYLCFCSLPTFRENLCTFRPLLRIKHMTTPHLLHTYVKQAQPSYLLFVYAKHVNIFTKPNSTSVNSVECIKCLFPMAVPGPFPSHISFRFVFVFPCCPPFVFAVYSLGIPLYKTIHQTCEYQHTLSWKAVLPPLWPCDLHPPLTPFFVFDNNWRWPSFGPSFKFQSFSPLNPFSLRWNAE